MARSMTVEHAQFWLNDILLGALKNESRTTKKVLEAVPADKAEHRPDPVSKTAMELVRHIAVAEIRFLETTIDGEFNVAKGAIPEISKRPRRLPRGMATGSTNISRHSNSSKANSW